MSAGRALADTVSAAVAADGSVSWGVSVLDLADRSVVAEESAGAVLPVASVGKLLLLLEVSRQVGDGVLQLDEVLVRSVEDAVADSGLWQHLATDRLPVEDLAVLVAAVSDNLATNVLLRRVGLEAVRATAAALGLAHTDLLDRVRDVRTAADPPTLARASARELTALLARLARGRVVSAPVSARVLRWLALNADTTLVAAGLGLDPLAHVTADRGLVLHNKTGTDDGIRAEAGVLHGRRASVAYAVLASWSPSGPDFRDHVLHAMRRMGEGLRRFVDDAPESATRAGTLPAES